MLRAQLVKGREIIIKINPQIDDVINILLNRIGIDCKPRLVASPDSIPAIIAPKEDAKNHTPIIWPIYLFGESLDIAANPIGLINNSPKV